MSSFSAFGVSKHCSIAVTFKAGAALALSLAALAQDVSEILLQFLRDNGFQTDIFKALEHMHERRIVYREPYGVEELM